MNEFFTNAVKSFKKNPITTLGIVVIAVVLIFMLHQIYNHIPTEIKEVNQKIDENQKEVNQKIDKLETKIDKLETKMDKKFDALFFYLLDKDPKHLKPSTNK